MARILKPAADVTCSVVFSECGKYRYLLKRDWTPEDQTPKILVSIGLNGSTADGQDDDPTISKETRFARMWGFTALWKVNLFGYRATEPKDMLKTNAPVGPENDRYLLEAVEQAHMILCSWGAHGKHLRRGEKVVALLKNRPLYILKLTNNGQPYHPLFLPETLTPFVWKTPEQPQ